MVRRDVAAGLPRHISNESKDRWRRKAASTPFFISLLNLKVISSGLFLAAFVIYVVTSGSNQETGTITGISGNNLTAQGLKVSHAAGAWVVLDHSCCAVYIQRGATQAGSMGIGNGVAPSLTGSEGLITILYPAPAEVQPAEFSDSASFGPNFGSTADYCVVGTASNNYLPSFSYIRGVAA